MKKEILNSLVKTGMINRGDKDDPNWKRAFDLYKKETNDTQVTMTCGSCYRKVLEWLNKS